MKTTATFNRVRNAYEKLVLSGQTPSASKIVAIVGGSKTTVLAHLKTIMEGLAERPQKADPARAMLVASAETMAVRIWEQARTLAEQSYESRLKMLLQSQALLFDELQVATENEEAALARATAAEARLAEVENQLAVKENLEEQISTLKTLIGSIRRPPDTPALKQLLKLLADGKARSKEEIYRSMLEMGYEAGKVQRARFHAIDRKYVMEGTAEGESATTLRITDTGKSKLAA